MIFQTQKSFSEADSKGVIYLVPTPIGNLEDMSFRAVRILKEADLIAAEDTRNTRKLLNHYSVETPVISYHEHNKEIRGKELIEKVKTGLNIALVSDAGMPIISDPGYELVQSALNEYIKVIPLPGANAALTALVASGITPQPFYFYGFLKRRRKEKLAELQLLKKVEATVILYESPHRLTDTLELILETLGDRQIALCRELTKKYEEFVRGTVSEILNWSRENEVRGEFCIVIEGTPETAEVEEQWWDKLSTIEHVDYYINEKKLSAKDAIKLVANDRGLRRREVYGMYHSEKE